jgi:FixJ family two-component response regulator
MTGAPVIHIVDDDASFRAAISRVLKVSGFEIADYESASCFLGAIEDAKPGCILLDVNMPSFDGLQLQEELANLSRGWPIIFMTAEVTFPQACALSRPAPKTSSSNPYPKKPCWMRSAAP